MDRQADRKGLAQTHRQKKKSDAGRWTDRPTGRGSHRRTDTGAQPRRRTHSHRHRHRRAHRDAPTHTDRQTHTCTRKHTHAHTISLFVCLSFPCLVTTRFVPDDMTFDEEARSSATDVPAGNYAPLDFTTQALQQSNVELTWDGDDARRVELTRRQ